MKTKHLAPKMCGGVPIVQHEQVPHVYLATEDGVPQVSVLRPGIARSHTYRHRARS